MWAKKWLLGRDRFTHLVIVIMFSFLLLWLHYPKRISASLGAFLHSTLSCATCLQLAMPIFLMLFSTSSLHLDLGRPLSHF
jgi:hypothetical protein